MVMKLVAGFPCLAISIPSVFADEHESAAFQPWVIGIVPIDRIAITPNRRHIK
jgi:hypothetical protein